MRVKAANRSLRASIDNYHHFTALSGSFLQILHLSTDKGLFSVDLMGQLVIGIKAEYLFCVYNVALPPNNRYVDILLLVPLGDEVGIETNMTNEESQSMSAS